MKVSLSVIVIVIAAALTGCSFDHTEQATTLRNQMLSRHEQMLSEYNQQRRDSERLLAQIQSEEKMMNAIAQGLAK